MNTWALIIIVIAGSMGSMTAPNTSTTIVHGFSTEKSCEEAKNKLKQITRYSVNVAIECIKLDIKP